MLLLVWTWSTMLVSSEDHVVTCRTDVDTIDLGSVDQENDQFIVYSHEGYDGTSEYPKRMNCIFTIMVCIQLSSEDLQRQ